MSPLRPSRRVAMEAHRTSSGTFVRGEELLLHELPGHIMLWPQLIHTVSLFGPEDVEQQEYLCFPRFRKLFRMSLSNWLTPTVNRWYALLTWQTVISLTRLTGPIAMAKYAWWCGA